MKKRTINFQIVVYNEIKESTTFINLNRVLLALWVKVDTERD